MAPHTDPEKRRAYIRAYMAKRRKEAGFRKREAEGKADWYQRNKDKKAEAQRKYRAKKRQGE